MQVEEEIEETELILLLRKQLLVNDDDDSSTILDPIRRAVMGEEKKLLWEVWTLRTKQLERTQEPTSV